MRNRDLLSRLVLLMVAIVALGAMGLGDARELYAQGRGEKAKTQEKSRKMNKKVIYLAGGCFWGTEHFFKQLRGVTGTDVGYANGTTKNPTYKSVCSGEGGFAETVRVEYDPSELSLELILDLFYKTIDPTSLNKQGGDRGTQYRTGIYYVDAESDLPIIRTSLSRLARRYSKPIVIECKPLDNFYSAEDYHQDYLEANPSGYCHIRPELFRIAKEANPKK